VVGVNQSQLLQQAQLLGYTLDLISAEKKAHKPRYFQHVVGKRVDVVVGEPECVKIRSAHAERKLLAQHCRALVAQPVAEKIELLQSREGSNWFCDAFLMYVCTSSERLRAFVSRICTFTHIYTSMNSHQRGLKLNHAPPLRIYYI